MDNIGLILGILFFIGAMFLCIINRTCAIIGLIVINGFLIYTVFIDSADSFGEGLLIILFSNYLIGNVFPDIYLRAFSSTPISELLDIQDMINYKKRPTNKRKSNDDLDFVLDEKGNIIWLYR